MNLTRTLILIMIGLSSGTAIAGKTDPYVESLKEPLKLDQKQIQELDSIYQETHDKIAAHKKEIRELYKTRENRIDNVLTTEQKKKLKEIQNPSLPDGPPQMQPIGDTPEQPESK